MIAEYESEALRGFVAAGGRKTSSEVLLAESVRAIKRRAAARGDDGGAELGELEAVIEGFELWSLTRELLIRAGRLAPSSLGTLDAIHLATALSFPSVSPCFVSYDRRQLDAARRAGLPTASPGAGAA